MKGNKMPDIYDDRSSGLESPGYNAAAVTPDDLADLPIASRALYVGGSGDVHVTLVGGGDVTLKAVPVGILPLRVRRVHMAGTTATDIVAVW
jgi:hypothetical protein